MAMLAEKRQKVRWILNPRQTEWSNDGSKFGQRCLEKMGWKSGYGLGANLQGSKEHVKVSVRSDNRGIGFKDRPEDVLPHQNNYAELLAQLGTDEHRVMPEPMEGKSLEVKSQKSRARLHYHKFTRSKDLSRYSQKDLECILGKPAKPDVGPKEESLPIEGNTIHRGDMKEYFKQKMKHRSHLVTSVVTNKSEDEETMQCFGFGFTQNTKSISFNEIPASCGGSEETAATLKTTQESEITCKKQKKGYANKDEIMLVGQHCTDTNGDLAETKRCQELKEKKKKKHKNFLKEEELPENESCLPLMECSEKGEKRKNDFDLENRMRKKRKNNSGSCEEMPRIDECLLDSGTSEKLNMEQSRKIDLNEESSCINSLRKKKKQKNNGHSVQEVGSKDCLSTMEQDINIVKNEGFPSVKGSRKKRKKDVGQDVEVPESEDCLPLLNCKENLEVEQNTNIDINAGIRCIKKSSRKQQKNILCAEIPESSAALSQTDNKEIPLTKCSENAAYEEEVLGDVHEKKRKKKQRKKEFEGDDNMLSTDCVIKISDEYLEQKREIHLNDISFFESSKKKKEQKYNRHNVPEVGSEACLPAIEQDSCIAINEGFPCIKGLKKKRKKDFGQNVVPDSEGCLPLANCNENLEVKQNMNIDMNKGILCIEKSSRKRQKNIEVCAEMPESSAALSLKDSKEIAMTKGSENAAIEEEVLDVHEKKRKKKQRKKEFKDDDVLNSDCVRKMCESTSPSDDYIIMTNINKSEENKWEEPKRVCSGIKYNASPTKSKSEEKMLKHKKRKQLCRQDEEIQNCKKSVTFSEDLLKVVLIPSREQLQSKSVFDDDNISCVENSTLATKDTPVKHENKTKESYLRASATKIPCKLNHAQTYTPIQDAAIKSDFMKPNLIQIINGVKYINGISEYAQKLPRRLIYAPDARKSIPYWHRKNTVAEFPGSNVMALGYGNVG